MAQSWMGQQAASAANSTMSWNTTLWQGATQFNQDWLYSAFNTTGFVIKNPKATNLTDAGYTQVAWTGSSFSNGFAPTTMAIGPERDSGGNFTGRLVGYLWAWGGTTGAGGGQAVSVHKVVPNDPVGREFFVDWNTGSGYNYWSGGEAFQGTGELYFSPGEGNYVNNNRTGTPGTAQMQICKPWVQNANLRAECRRATALRPATDDDRLALNNLYTYNFTIGSDMALDAEGNAYLLASNGAYRYLIKVKPGAHGTDWYFQKVLQWNNGIGAVTYWGMAFHDGLIYARNPGSLVVMNPLTKQMTTTPWSVEDFRDLASAQTAGTIRGTIFNDLNGNGVKDAGDPVLPNMTVELYKQGQTGPVSETQTDGLGEYNFIIDQTNNVDWYVRVKQPRIDGYNARQTYAGGYSSFIDINGDPQRGTANVVTPRCLGQATSAGYEGPCLGARTDGIDPSRQLSATDVFTDTGALVVTKVTSTTSEQLSVADFGLSIYGSYGDAPNGNVGGTTYSFPTTRAQNGPLSFQRTSQGELFLGDTPGAYDNGINDPAAAAHATDNGLQVRDSGAPDTAWVSAQDQILAVGGMYDFRIQVSGANASTANAKVWLSLLSSGQPTGTFTAAQTFPAAASVPDVNGYIYHYGYQVGTTAGISGLQHVFARARAGLNWDTITMDKPTAGFDWNTTPWVQAGEVEDYRMAVANGTIKLFARTLTNRPASFSYTLTNVSPTAPSSATDSITTNPASTFQPSNQAHAFESTNQAITIGHSSIPTNWRLLVEDDYLLTEHTYCQRADGTRIDVIFPAGGTSLTIPASEVRQQASLSCFFTYVPPPDPTESYIVTSPTPGSREIKVGGGATNTYTIEAHPMAFFPDPPPGDSVPLPYQSIRMTLAPVAGSGATATGATFADGTQTATCFTGAAGTCSLEVTATVAGTYTVTAAFVIGGTATNFGPNDGSAADNKGTDRPERRHPAALVFGAGPICTPGDPPPCASAYDIDNTGTREVVMDLSDHSQDRTGTIQLSDDAGNWVSQPSSDFTWTVLAGTRELTRDVDYSIAGPTESPTQPGRYTFTINSKVAGTLQVKLEVPDGTGTKVMGIKDATFNPGPPCTPFPSENYTINNTGTVYVGDSRTGLIKLLDCGNNPRGGEASNITFTVTKGGAPVTSGVTVVATENATSPGNYDLVVTSTVDGTFDIEATWSKDGTTRDLGTRPATFTAGDICEPGSDPKCTSTYTIDNTGEKIANNSDTRLGTIKLADLEANPITGMVSTDFTFTVTLDGGGALLATDYTITGPTETSTLGTYTFTISSKKAGTLKVKLEVDGTQMGTQDATFVAGPVCDPSPDENFTIDNTGTVNVGGSRTGLLKLRDCNDNIISGETGNISFTVTKDGSPVTSGVTITPTETVAGSGDYDLVITSTVDGILQVKAIWTRGGTTVELGPRPATFGIDVPICLPGDPDPVRCPYVSKFDIIDKTPKPFADWGFSAASSSWGFYVGEVTLYASYGITIKNAAGPGGPVMLSDVTASPLRPDGARFWPFPSAPTSPYDSNPTQLTCVAPLVGGLCVDGVYNIRIYSIYGSQDGSDIRQIKASYFMGGSTWDEIATKEASFDVADVPGKNKTTMVITPVGPPLRPNNSDAYTVTVTVMDEGGNNPISGATINFSVADASTPPGGGASLSITSQNTSAAGIATTEVTAGPPNGSYEVSAKYAQDSNNHVGTPASLPANQKSPQTVTFETGVISVVNSTYKVQKAPIVADGTSTGTITVWLRDDDDLPVGGKADWLMATGPTFSPLVLSEFTETGVGVYTATVSSDTRGDYLIEVWVLDPSWGDWKLVVLEGPAGEENDIAHFVSGPLFDWDISIAPCEAISTLHPRVYADGTDCYKVTVVLRDQTGNPVSDWYSATPPLNKYSANANLPGASIGTVPTQTTEGTYTIDVTSTEIRDYVLSFYYGPTATRTLLTPTQPASFGAEPPDVDKSTFTLDAGPKRSNNPDSYYTATVKLVDPKDRPITDALTGPAKLSIETHPTTGLANIEYKNCVQTTATSGIYTCEVYGVAPGNYTQTLAAWVGGPPLGWMLTQTQDAAFQDTPDWTKSTFEVSPVPGTPVTPANSVLVGGTDTGIITVYVRDQDGALMDLPQDQLDALTAEAKNATGVAATVASGPWTKVAGTTGTYTKRVWTNLADIFTVTVTSTYKSPAESATAGSNDKVRFRPDVPHIPNTLNSLETKDSTSAADGYDLGWARVTVVDEYDNLLPNVNVCFNLMYAHPTPGPNAKGPRWDDGSAGAPGLNGAVPTICANSGADGVALVNAASIFPSEGEGFVVRASIGTEMTTVAHQKYLKYTLNAVDPTKSYFTVQQSSPGTGDVLANGSHY
ncbi:MAG: hypothetical protein FWD29_08130, partial [Micrococcales bacterium]|nr:hypothetical protein [Micrococcales bacterium]